MPSDAADFTGRMATVTGWGRLKYGGGVPSVLQEVQVYKIAHYLLKYKLHSLNLINHLQVPVIENSVCQEMFHTAGHNKKILPSFLCAGYANGQKDSCEVRLFFIYLNIPTNRFKNEKWKYVNWKILGGFFHLRNPNFDCYR